MSAKKWVLTFNKSNLRIVLVGFLLISGVQAETRGPIKIITQDGVIYTLENLLRLMSGRH